MRNLTAKNVGLVLKREYLETVRTKAFKIMTILTPFMIVAWSILPSMMMMKSTHNQRNIVVVTTDEALGNAISQRLTSPPKKENKEVVQQRSKGDSSRGERSDTTYHVRVSTDLSDPARKALQADIDTGKIDGFLWLDPQQLDDHSATYLARETNDFVEIGTLQGMVRDALVRRDLTHAGADVSKVDAALKPLDLEAITWEKGQAKKVNFIAQFMLPFALGFFMFMIVMLYGIGVMRAVLEEKSNRVMEVLMSTLTPAELMVGKILGIGAAGLTQVAVWIAMAALGIGSGAAMSSMMKNVNVSPMIAVYFAVFFILGFFLYSTFCAAIGAIVNTEREAQQLQQFAMLPLIISFLIMMFAMRAPNDPLVVVASFVPVSAPLLMFMRVVVHPPPIWQILVSIAGMIITIFVSFFVAGRIYRVGVLMYGKKPTLPEIIKWIKYA
jgi:ABC-2 type transport system permease protein